ncbi:hypothetical protein QN277_024371 [Acacia crassicarpa]|uniref:Uncharacterized protein n=1 Tax=Acacia crassicarpa TaxID=499986 RepID=A0AAE1JF35_9FABA|nr:hypothetical protein QN277_024371 [Acacia crassicarpa]
MNSSLRSSNSSLVLAESLQSISEKTKLKPKLFKLQFKSSREQLAIFNSFKLEPICLKPPVCLMLTLFKSSLSKENSSSPLMNSSSCSYKPQAYTQTSSLILAEAKFSKLNKG